MSIKVSGAVYSGSILLRIVGTAVLLATAGLLSMYGFMTVADQQGQFSVTLDRSISKVMSLSESENFDNPTTDLSTNGLQKMTNISGMSIDDSVDEGEGLHCGDNYFAYSFYVKNTGNATFGYREKFLLEKATKGVDAALRIRIYRNGVPITYAKISADGKPEYGTEAFPENDVAVDYLVSDFAEGEVNRYTIVIWVEGDDPECLDNIKGGSVKLSMNFSLEEEEKS